MADQRKFSRERHRIKLNQREEIESELRSQVEPLLREAAPSAPRGSLVVVAELLSVVASQLLSLPQAKQRSLQGLKDLAPDYATAFVEHLVHEANREVRAGVRKIKALEAAPLPGTSVAPDWAGPMAGPTAIERHFGIPRSTLYRWQKRHEVVWLNTRTSRKPVFPLKQFIDGRPEVGIADVVQAFRDPRSAWQWLMEVDLSTQRPFIDLLLEKRAEYVIEAAKAEVCRRQEMPSSASD